MKIFRTATAALACTCLFAVCQNSEDAALAAYAALLDGDISLFEQQEIDTWALDSWMELILIPGEIEYTYLDLDGDGTQELLLQRVDSPSIYNGVFHYENGRLFCWQNDGMEATCRDYPLRDGTMVRQYDFSGSRSYTLFRYQADGSAKTLSTLFACEEVVEGSSTEQVPCYKVNNQEVDSATFQEQLDLQITSQLLERSAWIPL